MNEIGETNIKLLTKGIEVAPAFLDNLTVRVITSATSSDYEMASLNE
jgi:hypothetical protein